ncbi:hypothetical protein [Philodulcilactobacillus myokoensis]|uniref:hypothetical protein n=1 Tax=Philodulcilactobacillus myokoensis TaxID=2929573 RepID=UPI002570B636|nr:hypothetical protein [Philodulcilactobacillus myokoensis]
MIKNLNYFILKSYQEMYLYIYLLIGLFMFINLYNYRTDFIGKKFFWNWIIYALNQPLTANFVIPILFIITTSTLLSKLLINDEITIRLSNRFNIWKVNISVILLNTINFIITMTLIILLLSFSIMNIQTNWNSSSINSFQSSFNGLSPFHSIPIVQVLMSIVLFSLFLLFWGIVNQILTSMFKNKATPIFIVTFLLIFQGKVNTIPGFPDYLVKILPENYFLLYSDISSDIFHLTNIYQKFWIDILYWVILISISSIILMIIYRRKQFK